MPLDKYNEYLDYLVDKTYKILLLKECNSPTLNNYLEGYLRELIGNKDLFTFLKNQPRYISILNIVQYFITNDCTVEICRKDVFKCIRIIKSIKSDLNKE